MGIDKALALISEQFSGRISLYAEDLTRHVALTMNPDEVMETASTIKLPVAMELLHQVDEKRRNLNAPVTIEHEDFVEGSGMLQHLTRALPFSLRDLATLMIIVSDNIATNTILRIIDLESVNQTLRQLSFEHTKLYKPIELGTPGPIGLTTAREMARLLHVAFKENFLSPSSQAILWDIMSRQQYNTALSRYLPYEMLTSPDDTPPPVVIGSKSGALEGIRNDVGLIRTPWGPYTIAIFTDQSQDRRFHMDNEAFHSLPLISRLVFDYYKDLLSS